MHKLFLAALIAAPCLAIAADGIGVITVLESQALIYRGSGRLNASEGVQLDAGDIVETTAAAFVQVEMADRTVVQLGPTTRVMLGASASRQSPERWLYIMDGWVKVSSAKRDPAAGAGFELRAAQFEIPANLAVVVLRNTPEELKLFVELGAVRITERQPRGASPVVASLKAGDFYQRKPPTRGTVAAGAAQAFVGDMPQAFRDSPPLRIERFKDHPVQARDAPSFDYADVQSWLQAEPAVRRPLMQRWRSKVRESTFRAALVANLRAHPEWDPILFPEKYKPKDPPRPVIRPASAAASQ